MCRFSFIQVITIQSKVSASLVLNWRSLRERRQKLFKKTLTIQSMQRSYLGFIKPVTHGMCLFPESWADNFSNLTCFTSELPVINFVCLAETSSAAGQSSNNVPKHIMLQFSPKYFKYIELYTVYKSVCASLLLPLTHIFIIFLK